MQQDLTAPTLVVPIFATAEETPGQQQQQQQQQQEESLHSVIGSLIDLIH